MFDVVGRMEDIPLHNEHGNAAFLRDVATPKDASFIQTNVVRVNGRRQVYIPVFRQLGSSTLDVVDTLKGAIDNIKARLTSPAIDLKVVMDQSVYVRHSIESLVEEGVLGAVLCSLVILLFLGEWRMTVIAVLTIPVAVLASLIGLYASGNTINVMTLAGLSLAIGPLVDSAIICLENTHRHLGLGASPEEAAFRGASEVAMPELVASLCTLLVLAPLALMPGLGEFLFRPMAAGVAFAMIFAYLLSRTFVPARSRPVAQAARARHGHGPTTSGTDMTATTRAASGPSRRPTRRHARPARPAFARWEALIEAGIGWYVRQLDRAMNYRLTVVLVAVGLLVATLVGLGSQLRREFFPRSTPAPSRSTPGPPAARGSRRPRSRSPGSSSSSAKTIGEDLELIICEIGVVADLVGRLHAQRRPDGRGRQGPAQARARALGPGIRREAPHGACRGIPSSATWNSPSTPAA